MALDSVVFDDALTFIGDSAFCDCKSLRKLLFNPNLHYIGNYAFANSPQLSDYTLPESLTHLGVGAFRNTLVDDLRIPPGIRKVPRLAFAQCSFTPAATVTLAEGIDEICDSAFFRILPIMQDETYADSVTLILPSTLKRIGFSAFETVWLKASKLPEHDESGAPIVWKVYLNGVLQEDDVRFIGGYMRTGRQRAALYEYVCEPRPNADQSSLPSVPSPSSPSRLFDLSGRPASSSASGLHIRLSQDGSSRLELRR